MSTVSVAVEWHLVGSPDEIGDNEPKVLKIGKRQIAIYRLGSDSFSAVSDICTHEYASLSKGFRDGNIIECPLHQACFDLRDGKCHGPVAEVDLETFPLRIETGQLLIGIPA
jgi:nitrite reductase/ring-hydroxylating ferredoxin subunit